LESVHKKKGSLILGKKISELPLNLQERIEDTQLTLYILDFKAPQQAKFDLFERMNSAAPLIQRQIFE